MEVAIIVITALSTAAFIFSYQSLQRARSNTKRIKALEADKQLALAKTVDELSGRLTELAESIVKSIARIASHIPGMEDEA